MRIFHHFIMHDALIFDPRCETNFSNFGWIILLFNYDLVDKICLSKKALKIVYDKNVYR